MQDGRTPPAAALAVYAVRVMYTKIQIQLLLTAHCCREPEPCWTADSRAPHVLTPSTYSSK